MWLLPTATAAAATTAAVATARLHRNRPKIAALRTARPAAPDTCTVTNGPLRSHHQAPASYPVPPTAVCNPITAPSTMNCRSIGAY